MAPAALADEAAAVAGAGALDAESVSESSLDRPALPLGAVLPPEAPPVPVPEEGAALLLAAGEGTALSRGGRDEGEKGVKSVA